MKEFDRHTKVAALDLTDLQKSFAERYVEHFNANKASSKCTRPSVVAKEWLTNPSCPNCTSEKTHGCLCRKGRTSRCNGR